MSCITISLIWLDFALQCYVIVICKYVAIYIPFAPRNPVSPRLPFAPGIPSLPGNPGIPGSPSAPGYPGEPCSPLWPMTAGPESSIE